jgi:hypothetical protein
MTRRKNVARLNAMPAFLISVNGRKLCTAGLAEDGVVTTIVNAISNQGPEAGAEKEVLELHVGGLISRTREHVAWLERQLEPGDEISIRILDHASPDAPRRKRETAAERKQWQQAYVRRMAEEFGWTIQESHAGQRKVEPSRGRRRNNCEAR